MSRLALAFRNVFRHRARSAVALVAIAFAVVALILAGGFIEWIFWAIREAAIQTGLGHVQITRTGYRAHGAADPYAYLLPAPAPELEQVRRLPEVKALARRLLFTGLASRGDTTVSFKGEGILPDEEGVVSRIMILVSGKNLDRSDGNGLLLGQGLAKSLGAKPGDTVALLVNTPSGGINAVEGPVRGIISNQVKAYDDVVIRLPLALAQQLTRTHGEHVWVLALRETSLTAAAVEKLKALLPAARFEIVPWIDLSDFYRKTVTLFGRQVAVVEWLIGFIVLFAISNTLMMGVLERTGEIGTLMAMGERSRQILHLFLTEGVLLGLIGGLIGVVVGVALAWIISAVGIPMPPPPGRTEGYSGEILLTAGLVAGAFALVAGATVAASFYPAWKASRMVIVDALRFNR